MFLLYWNKRKTRKRGIHYGSCIPCPRHSFRGNRSVRFRFQLGWHHYRCNRSDSCCSWEERSQKCRYGKRWSGAVHHRSGAESHSLRCLCRRGERGGQLPRFSDLTRIQCKEGELRSAEPSSLF